MSVGFIGNFGGGKPARDGQRIKTCLYRDLLIEEGFEVQWVDVAGRSRRPLFLMKSIRKLLKNNDILVFAASARGACILARMIYLANKKYKRKVIYPVIGNGPIARLLPNPNELAAAKKKGITSKRFPRLLQKSLASIDAILLEQRAMVDVYKNSFGLTSCIWVSNFRKDSPLVPQKAAKRKDELIRFVFFARMAEDKGPLDLLRAVARINENGPIASVDFYGAFDFESFQEAFLKEAENNPNAAYRGAIAPDKATELLSSYDYLCFPTRHLEGIPGTIVESLIAGTPVITSDFMGSEDLISDGETGFIYPIGKDPQGSLEKALLRAIDNRQSLSRLSANCLVIGKQYQYSYWRDLLMRLFGRGNK